MFQLVFCLCVRPLTSGQEWRLVITKRTVMLYYVGDRDVSKHKQEVAARGVSVRQKCLSDGRIASESSSCVCNFQKTDCPTFAPTSHCDWPAVQRWQRVWTSLSLAFLCLFLTQECLSRLRRTTECNTLNDFQERLKMCIVIPVPKWYHIRQLLYAFECGHYEEL